MGGRRFHSIALLALVFVASASTALGAGSEEVEVGWGPQLEVSLSVEPRELPIEQPAPARLNLSVEETTSDGSTPRPMSELVLKLSREFEFDVEGYPRCGLRDLRSYDPELDQVPCPQAVLGRGVALLHFGEAEQKPLYYDAPLTVFNAGVEDGAIRILLLAEAGAPFSPGLVVRMNIEPVEAKPYGYLAGFSFPAFESRGSFYGLRLRLGKVFVRDGERASAFSATCKSGKFQTGATGSFIDGTTITNETLRTCLSDRNR